ncbi:hypothetical protein Taro_050735 [Colocasia esculenta]|uniref:DUF4283 domain-containing protein n=1 Tax=Colocasia esculenta TaxID=4460 RepID=A0A843XE59_COLES|nr:hypothetical protein [Colocasia esculenta]
MLWGFSGFCACWGRPPAPEHVQGPVGVQDMASPVVWDAQFDFNDDPTIMPMWVGFPMLPVNYYYKDFLKSIAGNLGQVLRIYEQTLALTQTHEAFLCVKLDITMSRPGRIWIGCGSDGFLKNINNYIIPAVCGFYHKLGHADSECDKKHKNAEMQEDPPKKTVLHENVQGRISQESYRGFSFGIHAPGHDLLGSQTQVVHEEDAQLHSMLHGMHWNTTVQRVHGFESKTLAIIVEAVASKGGDAREPPVMSPAREDEALPSKSVFSIIRLPETSLQMLSTLANDENIFMPNSTIRKKDGAHEKVGARTRSKAKAAGGSSGLKLPLLPMSCKSFISSVSFPIALLNSSNSLDGSLRYLIFVCTSMVLAKATQGSVVVADVFVTSRAPYMWPLLITMVLAIV